MLDKNIIPTGHEIEKHLGKKAIKNVLQIKRGLEKLYEINIEIKFPFGNNYGWGYKISNKTKHLFYLFFEKGSITAMIQINKIKTEKELEYYNKLSWEGKNYWENRYPCGENGGWIHYRILNREHIKDIGLYLSIKTGKEIEL